MPFLQRGPKLHLTVTLCMHANKFLYDIWQSADIFQNELCLKRNSLRKTISMQNILDPDQAEYSVRPDFETVCKGYHQTT